MPFRTLDNLDVAGKRVLLRADLNVPVRDGKITDLTRIERLSPTIRELVRQRRQSHRLQPFRPAQGQARAGDVARARWPPRSARCWASACGSPRTASASPPSRRSSAWPRGDVLVLENTRYHAGEEKNDPAFAAELAKLADIFVNDAFSAAHRAHASTEGVAHLLPAYAGRLMQAELEALDAALGNPVRPVAAVVGGAKVSTKLELLGNLVAKVDVLVIGGAMANTFLAAQGMAVGKSLQEAEMHDTARGILAQAGRPGARSCCRSMRWSRRELKANPPTRTVGIEAVPADAMILDVGPATVARPDRSGWRKLKTLVWNGPLGAFETPPFDAATTAFARAVAAATQSGALRSVAGGGDTVSALRHAGVLDKMSYVSTAGGAFLEWLEGKTLPGVAAL